MVAIIQTDPNKERTGRIITRWLKRHLHRLGAGVNLDRLESLVEDKDRAWRYHHATAQALLPMQTRTYADATARRDGEGPSLLSRRDGVGALVIERAVTPF